MIWSGRQGTGESGDEVVSGRCIDNSLMVSDAYVILFISSHLETLVCPYS
jgi:hypothetical protein